MAVGVKAAVGMMLAGRPFLFVQVWGMILGAAQDCQGHVYAEKVYHGNNAVIQKIFATEVAQKLAAIFPGTICEEVLLVGEVALNLPAPLFGWVCQCGVMADGLGGSIQLARSFPVKGS